MSDLARRIDEALRVRLFPHTPLVPKQLASAIGVSLDTLARNRLGTTRIFAENLVALCEFFAARGDHKFASEVLGSSIVSPPKIEQLVSADALIERLRPIPDKYLWIIDGALHDAPLGHADFIRSFLAFPAEAQGNYSLYAIRNLGAVEISLRTDGRTVIRHHGISVRPACLHTLSDWLTQNIDRITSVKVSVLAVTKWLDTDYWDAPDLLETLESRLVSNADNPSWEIDEISPDILANQAVHVLRNADRTSISDTMSLCENLGLIDKMTCIRDGVVFHLGADKPLPHDEIIGRPLRSFSDRTYGEIVEFQANESLNGEKAWRVKGTAFGNSVDYVKVAIPVGEDSSFAYGEIVKKKDAA